MTAPEPGNSVRISNGPEGMIRGMPSSAEPLPCHRCQRPVEVSRDQFDVFEHMHYVCFHYEYEHDPVDPDEECGPGGCPSAAVNPRPDRRPAGEPPRHDEVLASNWIWITSLRRFLELVSSYADYRFGDLDWRAIQTGLGTLTTENDTFSYPIAGQRELSLTIGKDPGGGEVQVRITGRRDRLLGARIAGLMDAFQ
jgi:hypothetical protein